MLMTHEEKIDYIQQVFRKAQGANICRTIKDFAEQLGVNYSSVSSAMNGSEKHLTDLFVVKVRRWAQEAGIEEGGTPKPQQQQGGVWIPPETLELYNNIAATCRNLSEILKKNLEE